VSPLAAARGVSVRYGDTVALQAVDLEIAAGDGVALVGRSGSGKTTLLHVLGGLVEPTTGEVVVPGSCAFVFQGSNLLPHFTAFENVAFARLVAGGDTLEPQALLELVGLGGKADSLPDELSGGEAQRVAIARALAQGPELLLCDEPTGHLDTDTGTRVLELIEALQERFGFALVIATHDLDVAARLRLHVAMRDGRVASPELVG
jgi:putative ABC transport system ATP-binding protein